MAGLREWVLELLWRGVDPLAQAAALPRQTDFQGWGSTHHFLKRAIEEVRPRIVLEVGVWKGASVITMAEAMKSLGLESVVIAVDTWLGSSEHRQKPRWFADLKVENGYPSIYHTFTSNILAKDLQDHVVPLPLDSLNAAELLGVCGIDVDVIHLDGGHSYESVMADLRVWWPRLKSGGVLVGDDYFAEPSPNWVEVRRAFHDFFKTDRLENDRGKCYIRKP